MGDGSVSIRGLSKGFGFVKALDAVSLEIARGEKFGLYGADGCGKTTLERIICTLTRPDGGSCSVFGLDAVKDRRQIRRLIGFVPSTFSLYPDLTVEENLKFHTGLSGLTFDKDDGMIAPLYRQLAPFADRLAGKLSGGMKQKLSLCCALVNRPRLLVLDEPTTGIDAISRKDLMDCLERLNKEFGTTIILSSPYRNEIMACDRAALIDGGRIVRVGGPSDILPSDEKAHCDCTSPPGEENVIEVKGLTKRFGSFTAVDGLSFNVRKGEIFGFLGSNGAGKTTALKILCGLSAPTSGSGRVAGFDLDREYEKIKLHIGYMSQRDCLPPDLTVRENLRLVAGIYGIGRKEADRNIDVCLGKIGLENYADRMFGSLPLGWKRRVGFAAATVHNPGILLLDEPTSGVDVTARRQMWDIIRDEAARGTTILVTTHNMEEAMWCDRQSIMVNGSIKAMGDLGLLVRKGVCRDFDDVFDLITWANL